MIAHSHLASRVSKFIPFTIESILNGNRLTILWGNFYHLVLSSVSRETGRQHTAISTLTGVAVWSLLSSKLALHYTDTRIVKMSKCVSFGLCLCFVATVGIIYSVSSRYWKVNSQVSSQPNRRGTVASEGLWLRCMATTPGTFQCDTYGVAYIGLTGKLNAQRAMMVIAGIFSVVGLIVAGLGLECCNAVEGKRKRLTAKVGGVLLAIAGILTLATVSWYAADVVRQFNYTPMLPNQDFIYTFGAALYVGWVASVLALVGGLLIFCCHPSEHDDDFVMRTVYKPPTSKSRKSEYV